MASTACSDYRDYNIPELFCSISDPKHGVYSLFWQERLFWHLASCWCWHVSTFRSRKKLSHLLKIIFLNQNNHNYHGKILCSYCKSAERNSFFIFIFTAWIEIIQGGSNVSTLIHWGCTTIYRTLSFPLRSLCKIFHIEFYNFTMFRNLSFWDTVIGW